MVMGVSGVNCSRSSTLLRIDSSKRGLHWHFSNVEANNLVTLTDHEDNTLESNGSLTRLLEALEGLGA